MSNQAQIFKQNAVVLVGPADPNSALILKMNAVVLVDITQSNFVPVKRRASVRGVRI